MKAYRIFLIAFLTLLAASVLYSCTRVQTTGKQKQDTINNLETNVHGRGPFIMLSFEAGPAYNHPLIAVWAEDTNGHYLMTFYVSESMATSVFDKSKSEGRKWKPGLQRRPAALPVWSHAYGYLASDGLFLPEPSSPVPDAYSGPTPAGSFILKTRGTKDLPEVYDIFLEINQSWDWNDYWYNARFQDEPEYKTSAQPSLVYRVRLGPGTKATAIPLTIYGHGHYAGADGYVYCDLSTFTTALEISHKISVVIN